MESFTEGAYLERICEHNVGDIRWRGCQIGRLNTADAYGAEGGQVVIIMVVLGGLAEILEPGGDLEDMSNGVKFLGV